MSSGTGTGPFQMDNCCICEQGPATKVFSNVHRAAMVGFSDYTTAWRTVTVTRTFAQGAGAGTSVHRTWEWKHGRSLYLNTYNGDDATAATNTTSAFAANGDTSGAGTPVIDDNVTLHTDIYGNNSSLLLYTDTVTLTGSDDISSLRTFAFEEYVMSVDIYTDARAAVGIDPTDNTPWAIGWCYDPDIPGMHWVNSGFGFSGNVAANAEFQNNTSTNVPIVGIFDYLDDPNVLPATGGALKPSSGAAVFSKSKIAGVTPWCILDTEFDSEDTDYPNHTTPCSPFILTTPPTHSLRDCNTPVTGTPSIEFPTPDDWGWTLIWNHDWSTLWNVWDYPLDTLSCCTQ